LCTSPPPLLMFFLVFYVYLLSFFYLIYFSSFYFALCCHTLSGYRRQYSDSLRAEWFGDRDPVTASSSLPVQTDSETHSASCTIYTESFPGVGGRVVMLANDPHLAAPMRMGWSCRLTSDSPLCLRRHFMGSLARLLSYVTLYPSNGNTTELSVLLCYVFICTYFYSREQL
jgi:hypothetical protein